MPITMQGNWTVRVKSKAADWAQRFIISGSDNADGTYEGDVSTAPVSVIGAQWSITVQHRQGSGKNADWVTSADRLGAPSQAGSDVIFDILSNDSGGDSDYNDLVLTCSTPLTASEYVVYGKARSYAGLCRFNPCFPRFIVIDTYEQLVDLIRYNPVLEALKELYPERIKHLVARPRFKRPIPEPDPQPFRPMMIPLDGMPDDQLQVLRELRRGGDVSPEVSAPAFGTNIKPQVSAPAFGTSIKPQVSAPAFTSSIAPYVRDLAKIKDLFRPLCVVKNQPGLLLRFIEYDRTESELSGGAYTGTGDRHFLGYAVTDELGNYIFHFSHTLEDIAEEFDDIETGGVSLATQLRPDLIVQVIGGGSVLFETALFANIPNFKRINLCIPESRLNPGPTACQGGRAIQSIGNIWTIPGLGNTLDAAGRITATNAAGPKITRGAWVGRLDFFACFTDHPNVAYYTLRFRKPGGAWQPVQEYYEHPRIADIGSSPDYTGTKVGPFTTQPLKIDGGPAQTHPYYLNIESSAEWVITHRTRKIRLSSWIYEDTLYPADTPDHVARTVEFRIEGYTLAGDKVTGADDTIRLFIDHRPVVGELASIAMGGVAPGECGLFELPSPNATLTARFRVHQPGGFVAVYNLEVWRGSATPVAVSDVVAPAQPLSLAYNEPTHGDTFYGTYDAVGPDIDGYVVAELQADAGAWLPAGKNFCSFAFEVYATRRSTDGYSLSGAQRMDIELVGISYTAP